MHDGCSGNFENGQEVVDTVRMMGFAGMPLPIPLPVSCHNCTEGFVLATFEYRCPSCGCVHAVTPCHAFDPDNVVSVGVDY